MLLPENRLTENPHMFFLIPGSDRAEARPF